MENEIKRFLKVAQDDGYYKTPMELANLNKLSEQRNPVWEDVLDYIKLAERAKRFKTDRLKAIIDDLLPQLQEAVDIKKNKEHQEIEEEIDTSQFETLTSKKLVEILGLTIKHDDENKLVTFLCQLSAYTESSQFNISFNAPSSTGKSYIPTEVCRLFPKKDVVEIGYCSPTAFFHDTGEFNKERGGYEVDLSRKILIFLDQPHTQLLERLRPLLSHDEKEMRIKITDKNQKHGMRTKHVFIKGFPAVIFCSAGLKIDEQESTRFLLLSPETNQDKIKEAIQARIRKESDGDSYRNWIDGDLDRALLKTRIKAIRNEKIDDIKIINTEKIEERFLSKRNILKPRHQRDIGRLISLIKSLALLNVWFRDRKENVVIASDEDIEEGINIWDRISESQEHNLPPYIFSFYKDIIQAMYDGISGISRNDIRAKHLESYGRSLSDWQLRQEIIPMLETAGLIYQEKDPEDNRRRLIYPTLHTSIVSEDII